MQIKHTSGKWRIEANLRDAGERNRPAITSAISGESEGLLETRHTVVVEHVPGCDEVQEAKNHIDRVLSRNH